MSSVCPLFGGKKTEKQKEKWISRVSDVTLGYPLFIYANNEPKSAYARDLGDCHDNKGKHAKRVFTCFRQSNFSTKIDQIVKRHLLSEMRVSLESLPGTPIEKQQQREELQTSGKHIEGQDQLGEVGEEPEVLGRAYKFQSRSDVI